MGKTTAIWAAGLAALAWAGSPHAHHSGSVYEATPVWVKGTVVRFENINPHTITTLEYRSGDRQVRRWAVEGPGRFQLDRMGIGMDMPKLGEAVEFCAFPYKEERSNSRPSADSNGVSVQRVAGHVMVTADGDKRIWEPHGVISECIRSSEDQRQSWLEFLDSDARARQAWCQQRRYAHNRSAALRELVEEIDSLIDNPCG